MIKVLQTKFCTENQNGNCLAACLASILELRIEDIPQFEDMFEDWWPNVLKFLGSKGLYPLRWDEEYHFNGFYLVRGTSPRDPEIDHQVIYFDGKIIHDPHPDNTGVLDVKETIVLVPYDPSNFVRR